MKHRTYGLLLAIIASPGLAADFDNSWLRGSSSFPADPPPLVRWNGVYGGGQIGEDFRGVDFRSATNILIANISTQDANFNGIPLTSFNQLSVVNTKGPSFGGFIGYNYQIDDIVAGFEFNLNASPVQAGGADSHSRTFSVSQQTTTFTVTTGVAAKVNDYGTARMRFGWVYGSFLPYVFGGVSVSQVDTSRSANVAYLGVCPPSPPPCTPIGSPPGGITQSDISHGKWTYGFDAGLGIDYALTRNIFLRGEAEYLQLSSVNDIKINNVSTRIGMGLRY